MDELKRELQSVIAAYSDLAISKYERALIPMSQEKRIEAGIRKQNLVASLARLEADPSGASIEKARDEINFSQTLTWAMKCMTVPSHHVEIKDVAKSRFLEGLQREAARFDGLDFDQLSEADVEFFMAIATLVDIAATVLEDGTEYGSCLFSQSNRFKTIRTPLSVMQQAGCEYVVSSGQAFIKRGDVYLEVESVDTWGRIIEIHLSGKEFLSQERSEMEYVVELEKDSEYLVMGSMTPKQFLDHCKFRQEVDFDHFEPFSLMDKRRIKKWIKSEGGGLLIDVTKLKYHSRRIYATHTWLFMEGGQLVRKEFVGIVTRRIDINISTSPGITLGAPSSWDAGSTSPTTTSHLMRYFRRESGLKGENASMVANISAHAFIMINNYHRPPSGPVLNHNACLYSTTSQNGVRVNDTRWLAATLAGWELLEEANCALDPNGEEFELVPTSNTTGIAHASRRTGYNRIEHSGPLENLTKVY